MAQVLELERRDTANATATDDDFVLDMRVVESTTPLVIMMCSTSDGCGQSCSTSACTTKSCDPV